MISTNLGCRSKSQQVRLLYEVISLIFLSNAFRLGIDNAGWARQENTNVMPSATEMGKYKIYRNSILHL